MTQIGQIDGYIGQIVDSFFISFNTQVDLSKSIHLNAELYLLQYFFGNGFFMYHN